jgi:AraC-like DNA-binding protein
MSDSLVEYAHYSRGVNYPDIELLQARYTRHAFTPHFHDGYAVGVVEAGALTNRYKHNFPNTVAAGEVFVIHPGDVHTGRPVGDQGVVYRMLYLPPRIAAQWVEERNVVSGVSQEFAAMRRDSQAFSRQLIHFHQILAGADHSLLEQECLLVEILAQLFLPRYSQACEYPDGPCKNSAVEFAKAYIRANFPDNLSLHQLAALVNVSPFHFLRMFQRQVGLSPHAYQTQVRVEQAKRLILQHEKLTRIGGQVGFFDQSHFIKAFKALVGVTPGQYLAQAKQVPALFSPAANTTEQDFPIQ